MKAKVVLKSFAELSANALELAASMPAHAVAVTRSALGPPVKLTRRQIRAARQHSKALVQSLMARATTPLSQIQPWPRGGINE
jgi:hypothetical protein